jgi:hypothetical protein
MVKVICFNIFIQGILNNMKLDAQTFADWKVDYVKLDGCYSFPSQMDKGKIIFCLWVLAVVLQLVEN